jgi:hypothetical protein
MASDMDSVLNKDRRMALPEVWEEINKTSLKLLIAIKLQLHPSKNT